MRRVRITLDEVGVYGRVSEPLGKANAFQGLESSMGFFKKLSTLFSGSTTQTDRDVLWVAVRCNRCGEVIRSRVNLSNDLSAEYGDEGTRYICRKQLMGEGTGERPCFQRIEVELIFDEQRRLAGKDIRGGQYIDAQE